MTKVLERPLAPWAEPAWQHLRALRAQPPAALLLHAAAFGDAEALAERYARLLLCEAQAEAAPCGSCRGCREAAAGTHPDLLRVAVPEDKREIGIDQIRQASDWCSRTARGRHRVLRIRAADRMNRAAANALLKTPEEPPPGVVIVLSAQRLHALPATIRSRCLAVALRQPEEGEYERTLEQAGLGAERVRAAQARTPGDLSAALDLAAEDVETVEAWQRAWRQGVEQGDTLQAAAQLSETDWPQAQVWLQRQVVAWAREPGAAALLQPAWAALMRLRRMESTTLDRLLPAEEVIILLRRAYTALSSPPRRQPAP